MYSSSTSWAMLTLSPALFWTAEIGPTVRPLSHTFSQSCSDESASKIFLFLLIIPVFCSAHKVSISPCCYYIASSWVPSLWETSTFCWQFSIWNFFCYCCSRSVAPSETWILTFRKSSYACCLFTDYSSNSWETCSSFLRKGHQLFIFYESEAVSKTC